MIKQQWLAINQDFDQAIQHLSLSIELFEGRSLLDPGFKRPVARMGLMQAMQMGYNYFEHGLEKIIISNDEYVTDSPNWSRDLIDHAAAELPGIRPPIITENMHQHCKVMIDFRNIIHTSDEFFTKKQTSDAVKAAKSLLRDLKMEHRSFRPFFLKNKLEIVTEIIPIRRFN